MAEGNQKSNIKETDTGGALFEKERILASERYSNQRDLVEALLEDGKTYTLKTVDNLIEKYRKGKVE